MLAERVLGDQRSQLSNQLAVPAEHQVDVDAEFDRGQPDLLEPGDGRLREVLVSEVGGGRPRHNARASRTRADASAVPPRASRDSVVHEPLEPVQVELVGSTCRM